MLVLGGALAGWACVRPFLRWRATTYSLTNRRLVMRTGVLNKVSVDLPLWRINDVSTQRSLGDRVLGCGTLVAQTAGEGSVALRDVPEVQHVQRAVSEQLFGELNAAPRPRRVTGEPAARSRSSCRSPNVPPRCRCAPSSSASC